MVYSTNLFWISIKMEKAPPSTYVKTFKSIAFSSFVLGLCLLSVCFWVLISLSEREDNTDNPTASEFRLLSILASQQPKGRSGINSSSIDYDKKILNNETECLENSIRKFKKSWGTVSPYFQGSCGIAVVLGLIQVISCMTILSSSKKGALKPIRAKVWKLVNLGVAMLLLICALIPITIDKSKNDVGIRNHLEEMLTQFMKLKPDNNIHVEGVDNMTLLYCSLIADGVVVIVLVVFAHVVLKCIRRDGK